MVLTLHDCLATPLSTTTTIDSLGLGPVSSSHSTHNCVSSFCQTMHCLFIHPSINSIAGIAIARLLAGLRAMVSIHQLIHCPYSQIPLLVNIDSKTTIPCHFTLRTAVSPVLGKHSSLPRDDCIGIRICRVRACCATQSGYRITRG